MTKCKFCKKQVNMFEAFFTKSGKPCHFECGQKFLKNKSIITKV